MNVAKIIEYLQEETTLPEKKQHSDNIHYIKTSAICETMTCNTDKYSPKDTIKQIQEIFSHTDATLILYSEISDFLFHMSPENHSTYLSNLEQLYMYITKNQDKLSEQTIRIAIKIYDHTQLANRQLESMNNVFAERITETSNILRKEMKNTEKEYISILGIFASVLLTFVGGITFSTSVLENISNASIYKLLLIVDFLGFVLINAIYLLIKFISQINNKNLQIFKIKDINIAFIIFGLAVTIAWLLDAHAFADFIQAKLVWVQNSFFV